MEIIYPNLSTLEQQKTRDSLLGIIFANYSDYLINPTNIHEVLSDDQNKIDAVFEQDRMTGFGLLSIRDGENVRYGSISAIASLPEFRGGLGKSLNQNLLFLASEYSCLAIETDPVLNFAPAPTPTQTEYYPNLANLSISTKLGAITTGYSLGNFLSVNGSDELPCNISVARMVIPNTNFDVGQEIESAKTSIVNYLSKKANLPVTFRSNNLKIKECDNGRVLIAESNNLNDFVNSSFIPCYFFPSYNKLGETIYFGIYYKQITPNLANPDNPFYLNIYGERGMSKILPTKDIAFLELLQKNIKLNYTL